MPRLNITICHGADLTTDHTAIVGSEVVMVPAGAGVVPPPGAEVAPGEGRPPPPRTGAVTRSSSVAAGRIWARRKSGRGRRAAMSARTTAHRAATAATGIPMASAAK